ncbi:MAG: heavy metal translocating P-type ATPase [Halothiobacillaceae bacterium]
MMDAGQIQFAALEVVHGRPGRVRFRYHTPRRVPFHVGAILQAVRSLPGVLDARVNPRALSLVVNYEPKTIDLAGLRAALLALPVCRGSAAQTANQRLTGVMASGGLLLASAVLPSALRLPATLLASLPLYGDALRDLAREGINSHVLEAMAVAISTARGDTLAANTTLFMLALGEHLEDDIARRSDALLKGLLRPQIDRVWVESAGIERQIGTAELKVGMTVLAGAGDVIPVDGTVLSGEGLINEATMTGEGVAVARGRGDRVLSGTVVEEGRLRIYAERVGGDTAVARIADYVERALAAKSATQIEAARLADRLVPGVLWLAGASWVVSADARRAASVLQADYSCALKLATPVAFKSSMYQGGRHGILIKGADVLERLAEADTFVFDKTGTLTTGCLKVTDTIAFDRQFGPEDIIDLAASVEEHYFHPFALAVVEAARQQQGRHFEHKEVQFIAAHGVASEIEGQRIVIGSRHFVEEDEGVAITAGQRRRIDRLFNAGKSLLYIGYGGRLIGVIALEDSLREEGAQMLARLRGLGVRRLVMLTGDHPSRAAEVARALGLDEWHADLLPHDKVRIVAEMKAQGARIAFVGDGINDAPALAGALVGIAMAHGADIARLTADIALIEDGLKGVVAAKALANSTLARITHNYRMTVGINSAILGAAAFGLLSPALAAILHNGTTIGILLNALRGSQRAFSAAGSGGGPRGARPERAGTGCRS